MRRIHVLYFLQLAAYFWSTWMLDDVMRAFEKIRGLVILNCNFSGRMDYQYVREG